MLRNAALVLCLFMFASCATPGPENVIPTDLSVTGITEGERITGAAILSIAVDSPSPLTLVAVKYGNHTLQSAPPDDTYDAGRLTFNWNIPFAPGELGPPGPLTIAVSATNNSGLETTKLLHVTIGN
jgi:hypothetical protein